MTDKAINIIKMKYESNLQEIIIKKEWFENISVQTMTKGKLYAIVGFGVMGETQPDIITYLNKLFMIYTVLAYEPENTTYGTEIDTLNNKLTNFDKDFKISKDYFIKNDSINNDNTNTNDLNTLITDIKQVINAVEVEGGRPTKHRNLTKQRKYRRTRSKSCKRKNKKSII